MPLSPGDKLGHYEVLSLLGVGGMGEVYRARDMTLKRDVALKVLPATFVRDRDRMARFQREAEVLASLDHPNIGHIHGIVDAEESRALVLALIEGPTLADRIQAGPLPLDEAIAIAQQIIEALEYAHDRGVVHRDLKPANIKITPDAVVKVLDFGLAKVLEDEPSPSALMSNSPTLTIGHTRAGMILGTAAYMSPEQAVGRPVDRRSDIFSFGAVLYEMLTGKRAFNGAATPDVLEAVVKNDPDWSALPAGTPSYLRKLLERMLTKDRKQRLQAIGEARIALENPDQGEPDPTMVPARSRWIWLSAFLALIAAGLGIVAFIRPVPTLESYRLAITPPPGLHFEFANNVGGSAISPDGRKIAFVAGGDLWIRSLDSDTAAKVPNASGGHNPFWAPDQRSIGFFVPGKVVAVELSSGSRTEITSYVAPRGASWNPEGTILYSNIDEGVFRVSSTGGTPVPVTKLDESLQETAHYHPLFLSNGDHFLYMVRSRNPANSGVFAGSLKDPKLKRRVAAALSSVGFVPAAQGYPGYLIFAREGALLAQRFDESALRTTGEPEAISASVGFLLNNQLANFSVSRTGTVVLGTAGTPLVQMTGLDRHGNATPVASPANPYNASPRLSHDGARVALFKYSGIGGLSLWSFDFKRSSLSRVDEDGGFPAWSADDRQLLYFSNAKKALVRKDISSGQPAEVVRKLDNDVTGSIDWSPDGQFAIAQSEVVSVTSGSHAPSRLPTSFAGAPRFSPDGKWLAYRSVDGEVVAQDFPAARARIQISNQGGGGPVWRRDMKEFFYIKSPSLMAVDISSTQSGLEFGVPHELFTSSIFSEPYTLRAFTCDATADGQRFLCVAPAPSNPFDDQLTVLLNWRVRLR